MSFATARAHLAAHGLADRVVEFDVSSATVELAAAAVGCPPECIAKTLAFEVDGGPILIVFAGDARVDNRGFKNQFAAKPRMIAGDRVESLAGHAPGGVCPFGAADGVPVYLASLRRFDVVYPAAGSANSAVRLTIDELDASGAVGWVDVSQRASLQSSHRASSATAFPSVLEPVEGCARGELGLRRA